MNCDGAAGGIRTHNLRFTRALHGTVVLRRQEVAVDGGSLCPECHPHGATGYRQSTMATRARSSKRSARVARMVVEVVAVIENGRRGSNPLTLGGSQLLCQSELQPLDSVPTIDAGCCRGH